MCYFLLGNWTHFLEEIVVHAQKKSFQINLNKVVDAYNCPMLETEHKYGPFSHRSYQHRYEVIDKKLDIEDKTDNFAPNKLFCTAVIRYV